MRLGVYVIDFDRDFLLSKGFDSLVFPFNTPENVLKEAEKDFKVYLEFKPFEGGILKNVFGERGTVENLGCPSDDDLRRKNLKKLEDVCYDVILDFVRFPSPANGMFFYSCFCDSCRRKARKMGFNLKSIEEGVKGYLKGGDVEGLRDWFEFKKEVIRDYVEGYGFKRAFFFSPSICFLVGQDYGFRLHRFHPMLYPEDLGPACIGYEVKMLEGPLKTEVVKALGKIDDSLIGREFKKLKAKSEPIIMISDNIKRRIDMLRGAERVYIFAYSKDRKNLFNLIR